MEGTMRPIPWVGIGLVLACLLGCWAHGEDRELISAAAAGDSGLVKELLSAGANIESEAFDDRATPLTSAAKNGHADTVDVLLRFGADPNHRDGGGTPAFWAAHSGQESILRLIVSKGGRLDLDRESEGTLRNLIRTRGDKQLEAEFEETAARERAEN
jgi:ankyrin repeat protein